MPRSALQRAARAAPVARTTSLNGDHDPPRARSHSPTADSPHGRAAVAVGYLRRSTDRQEQSIPDQQRAVEAYCAQRGLRLLRCYTDDAISGTSTVGRRAYQAMIADAQRTGCEFGTIVCYDVKRFSRVGNDEAGYYRHLLRTHGVEVAYASENFAGDGTDDLLRPVKQWQAREESKDLSKVTIRGLLTKSTTGHWMGGAPPFGYDLRYESQSGEFLFFLRYERDGSKVMFDHRWKRLRTLQRGETVAVSRRDHCTLVPGEDGRVKTVRRVFAMYADQGMGYKAIADRLNRETIATARGPEWAGHYSGQWALTTVRAILVNPAYCGDMVWNRRTDARFHRILSRAAVERKDVCARRLEPNDPSDWAVVRGAHPAIVLRRTWELAQVMLAEKVASSSQRGLDQRAGRPAAQREFRKVGDATGPRARFLLSKLVSCSRCGSRYEGYTLRTGRRDDSGQPGKTYTYACGAAIRRGKSVCSLGAVAQAALEGSVINAVVGYYDRYRGERGRALLGQEIRAHLGLEGDEIASTQRRARDELERVEGTTRRLLDNVTPASRNAVERRLAELDAERARLTAKSESLERLGMSQGEVRGLVSETAAFLASLGATLREGPLEARQAAMRRCVESVQFDEGDAAVAVRVVPLGASAGRPIRSAEIRASIPAHSGK